MFTATFCAISAAQVVCLFAARSQHMTALSIPFGYLPTPSVLFVAKINVYPQEVPWSNG